MQLEFELHRGCLLSCAALGEPPPMPPHTDVLPEHGGKRSWVGDVSKKDESCFHQLSSRLMETSAQEVGGGTGPISGVGHHRIR